jgi:glycopeptide antibiotics resistance protein
MRYIHFFPYPFLIGVSVLALVGTLLRKRGWAYLTGLTFLGFYTLALIFAMFFPFRVPEGWPANWSWDEIARTLVTSLNLTPLNFGRLFSEAAAGHISSRMVFWQTIGNVLITIPFGLGIGFLTRLRGWWVLLIAPGIGLTLEGMQLFFLLIGLGNMHVIDINDVLLNILGVLVGYGVYWIVKRGLLKAKVIQSDPLNH